MELKKGYKQTEIGLIPNDWELRTLGECAFLKRGRFTPRPRNNPIYFGGYIPFVQTGDITNSNGRIIEYSQTLNEKGLEVSKLFSKGTILMTIAANIGYSGILQIDMACTDSIVSINGFNNIDNQYLNYFFIFKREEIEKLATSGAQKNLSIELLAPFTISLPSNIIEQQAISQVLIDAEQLIENLKTLIAKKKAIKQGAMQELLTGKKRLRGFIGEWETTKLGEISNFHKGKALSKSQIKENGKTKCIHYGELFTKYSEVITEIKSRTDLNANIFLSKANDILMPTSDVTPRGLATASCINEDGVILGGDILVIRVPDSLLNGVFFSYLISINKDKVLQLVTGSTVYHLYGSDMAKFDFKLPKDIKEQNAIAKILSDMDAEIEALEIQLQKTQNLKQGMMQELLSGKIRLVKPVSQSNKKESKSISMAAEPEGDYKK